MKHKRSKAALGLIALVVLASGCTQGSSSVETTQTSAVQISEFSALPNTAYGGDTVRVTGTVKNTGGGTAESTSIQIFNLPSSWSNSNARMDFGSLRPPDPEAEIPSVSKSRTVELGAPSMEDRSVIPVDINGRLTFDYETTGTANMQLMSRQRFRQQDASISQPSLTNTGGPIQLSVKTRTPIIVYPNGDTASRFCIIVQNTEDGTPYTGSSPSNLDTNNRVELRLEEQSNDINLQRDFSNPVRLEDGQGVGCWRFGSVNNPGDIQTTVPVQVTADYGYMKETSTGITLRGESGGS